MIGWGRRRHYRVQLDTAGLVEAELVGRANDSALPRPLEVINTSAGGLALRDSPGQARPIDLGEQLEVELRLPQQDYVNRVAVQVLRVEPPPAEGELGSVGVCFVDPSAFYASMSGEGWTLFNRRSALRVAMDREPLEIWLGGGGLSEECRACDLSLYGLGAVLPMELAERLPPDSGLRLTLPLEHQAEPALLPGRVRHVSPLPDGENAIVGVAFDVDDNPRYRERTDKLGAFLVARQAQA